MIDKSTDLQNTTEPAITYSECYVQPFFSFYNADNMAIMKTFKDKEFDLAIVDPPYGIDWMQQIQNPNTKANWKQYENKEWDKQTPTAEYWKQLFRVSKNQIIWGGNYMTEHLKPSPCWLIWDKMQEFSGAVFEMAWTSFTSPAKAFRMSRVEAYANKNKIHPTQKPEKLYDWIITNYVNENDKVLDTHLGSGSIAIAIDKANTLDKKNLTFVGIELDPDYFRAAVERFKNHKRQCVLF
jgi:site-specific DNA-methyltransferase (adenine-specific)